MEPSGASERELSEWTVVFDQYELPGTPGRKVRGWRWCARHDSDQRKISSDESPSLSRRDSLGHAYFETKTEAEDNAVRTIADYDTLETREKIDGDRLVERVRQRGASQ